MSTAKAYEDHNTAVTAYVMQVIGPLAVNDRTAADQAQVLESCILASMELLHQGYGVPAPVAASTAELAYHRAFTRFVESTQ